jgi:hypothetical protein
LHCFSAMITSHCILPGASLFTKDITGVIRPDDVVVKAYIHFAFGPIEGGGGLER